MVGLYHTHQTRGLGAAARLVITCWLLPRRAAAAAAAPVRTLLVTTSARPSCHAARLALGGSDKECAESVCFTNPTYRPVCSCIV